MTTSSEVERFYVKLFRNGDLDWLALSGLTRGLYAELLLLADRAGRIRLGRGGLRALAVPMRDSWEHLEPHVAALVELGAVEVDGDTLVIPRFEEDQGRPKTGAERMAQHRARGRDAGASDETASRAVTDRHAPSPVTRSDAPASRVTSSDGASSRPVTDRHPPSRVTSRDAAPKAVTPRDASDDKERSDQKDQNRQKAEEGARVAPASAPQPPPVDKATRAILETLQSVPALERHATLAAAESFAIYVHNGAKHLDWILQAIRDAGQEATLAAGSSSGPMTDLLLGRHLLRFVKEARAPRQASPQFVRRGGTVGPSASDAEVEAKQRANGVQVGSHDWSKESATVNEMGGGS